MSVPIPSAMAAYPALARHTRLLAVGLGIVLLAFSATVVTLPAVWSSGRSHGYVAAAFGAWLLWRDRGRLRVASRPWSAMVWPLPLLSLLWLIGFVLNLQVVHQGALWAVLLLWLLAVCGPRALPVVASVGAAWSLALPIWEVLVPALQRMTVLANQALLSLTSIQATIAGDTITIVSGTFLVADSCAGLNFFMSGITIGTMYALLFLRRWRGRLAVVATAAAVSIVANWVRVFGLVLIGEYTSMQSPLMREHGTYGWLVFLVALPVFFLAARRLEEREARAHRASTGNRDELQLAADGEDAAAATSRGTPAAAVARVTAAALTGPLCFLMVSLSPDETRVAPTVADVVAPSPWQRVDSAAAPRAWQPGYRGASEERTETWQNEATLVQIDRLIYAHQTQGAELVASENRIAPDSTILGERLAGPLDAQARIVREAAIRTPDGVRLVWYWYRVAGTATSSPARAKLLELIAFMRRSQPSELIVVSTRCETTDCRDASRRLFSFVTGRDASAP